MLPACFEGLVILRQYRVAESRPLCSKPNSPPKIGRAALGDMLSSTAKLARLRDLYIKAGKGHQLAWCIKTVDVTYLADDDCTQFVAACLSIGDSDAIE